MASVHASKRLREMSVPSKSHVVAVLSKKETVRREYGRGYGWKRDFITGHH